MRPVSLDAPTIARRVADTGGRTTGFDYIRIALAVSIVVWHGIIVSYGPRVEAEYWQGFLGIAFRFVLPMFFALSGYLVAGSLERCRTLVSFFALRALRILPALAVEILLSALIFGPLLTTLPLAEYFGSPTLHSYFLNIVGNIHMRLPGVFEANPNPGIVNAQLWTVPSELHCYLVMGGLAAAGIMRSKWLLLVVAVLGQVLWVWTAIGFTALAVPRSPSATGSILVLAFVCGILMHLFRDSIRLHWSIFGVCTLVGVVLACLPYGGLYLAFPSAYMTVYLGLLNPPSNRFLRSGDYSYGLFLYGYPIQQVVASTGPAAQSWWINIALALPTTLAVAVLSWRFVEKPALSLRRGIPAIEERLFRTAVGRPVAASEAATGQPWLVDLGLKGMVLAGVAFFLNANDMPGALAILLALAAAIWFSRTGRPAAPAAISVQG